MKKYLLKITITVLVFLSIPLISYSDDELFDDIYLEKYISIEASNVINEQPKVNARHAIVLDRTSNQILFGKEEKEKCKMASTTKILTALIIIENCNFSDIVTISPKASSTGGSRLGLSTDDKISVEDLLYGLMLCSGNDAAVALAEYAGGSIEEFANLMNQKAAELNLTSSHFVTPHGLDEDEHYTSAYDLACLTDYALDNENFAKIVKTKRCTININGQSKNLCNTNELLGNFDGIYGVKTGFTNGANRCLVTSCKRGNLDVICIVLGCDTKKDRTRDSIKLLNYIFNNFKMVNIESIIDNNFEEWYLLHTNSFTINKGTSQILKLSLDKNSIPFSYMAVETSKINEINTYISFNSFYQAPIFSGTPVGTMNFQIGQNCYFSVNIINKNTIYKKNIFNYLFLLIKNFPVH